MSSQTEREATQPAAEMAEVETEKQKRQPQAGASVEREPAFVAESSANPSEEAPPTVGAGSPVPEEAFTPPDAAFAEAAPTVATETEERRLEAGATAAEADNGEISAETMEELIDQYSVPQQAAAEGQIVEAQVIALDDRGVFVSVGGKTECLIPAQEFADGDFSPIMKPGETVEVQLTDETKDGMRIVSYQRAHRRRAWQKLDEAFKNNETQIGRAHV